MPSLFPDLTRSQATRLIATGVVRVDGHPAKASAKTRAGSVVILLQRPSAAPKHEPMPLELAIVYQDDDVLVIDKPAGLVVHPAPGHASDTLVNALVARDPNFAVSAPTRLGIVHRLDKDTSGLILVALNDSALTELQRQFKEHEVIKEYVALVHGQPPRRQGVIDAPIGRDPRQRRMMAIVAGGRAARTHFEVLETFAEYSLLRVRLETGRTHQIRVHFAALGFPIAGDSVYGRRRGPDGLERQFLHASRLGFRRPGDGQAIEHTSPLPPDLALVVHRLRTGSASVRSDGPGQVDHSATGFDTPRSVMPY